MRVPVYERQGNINPRQAAQANPLMPAGDYGASVAQNVAGLATRLQQMQDATQDARTLELFNKFKADSQEYHENPDKGLYNTRQGYMAQGMYAEADEWLRKRGEEYARTFKSDRAKKNFRTMAEQYIQQRGATNSRYEADQVKKYQVEQAQATMKNYLNEIEGDWQNPETIDRARAGIAQALELVLRGSSREKYDEAWQDIEDQIGTARLRQAFVASPLMAIHMLENDPDIHLNPKTRAQLQNSYKDTKELYEVQAIANAHAPYYSPETIAQLYDDMFKLYGPEKGKKVFNTISYKWSLQNSQDNAQKKKNAKAINRRFLDENTPDPTENEIYQAWKNEEIDDTDWNKYKNYFDTKKAQAAKDATEAQKQEYERQKARSRAFLFQQEQQGIYPTDNALNALVESKYLTPEEARGYKNREAASKEKKQKQAEDAEKARIKKNEEWYIDRLIFDENLTADDLRTARKNGDISAEFANTHIKALEAKQEKLKAAAEKEGAEREKLEKEAYQDYLDIIINNGGVIPHETVNKLLSNKRIERGFAEKLYAHEDKVKAADEKAREELLKQVDAQQKEEAKLAAAEKENKLREIGLNYGKAYYNRMADAQEEIRKLFPDTKDFDTVWKYARESASAYNSQLAELNKEGKETRSKVLEARKNELQNIGFTLADEEPDPTRAQNKLHELFPNKEDYDVAWQYYQQRRNALSQTSTAENNAKKEIYQDHVEKLFYDYIQGNFLDQDGSTTKLQAEGLKPEDFSKLKTIQDNFVRTQADADKKVMQARAFSTAQDLIKRFPVGQEQDAYDEINSIEDRETRNEVDSQYNRLLQEQRTVRTEQEKAHAAEQDANRKAIINEYLNDKRGPQLIPNRILLEYEANDGLSKEHLKELRALNASIATRAGMEAELMKRTDINFAGMSPIDREHLVMTYMGTNEARRHENFLYLYNKVLNGTATDAEVDSWYAAGWIDSNDKERLKNHDKELDKQKRATIKGIESDIMVEISKLAGSDSNMRHELTIQANNEFLLLLETLDVHANNFNEALQKRFDLITQHLVSQYTSKKKEKGLFGLTSAGERAQNMRQWIGDYTIDAPEMSILYEPSGESVVNINPEGTASDFNNTIEIPAPPQPTSEDIYYSEIPQEYQKPYYPQPLTKNEQRKQTRIAQYDDIITESADKYGVEPELVKAIAHVESAGNSNAISSAGAQGLMQLMPDTAKDMGVTDSFDPRQNIMGGTKYIATLINRYGGDIAKALWAYNAGPGNVDKGRKPKETRKYINDVMTIYNKLKGGYQEYQKATTPDTISGAQTAYHIDYDEPLRNPLTSADAEYEQYRDDVIEFLFQDWKIPSGIFSSNDYGM